jgi:hypothetical protein
MPDRNVPAPRSFGEAISGQRPVACTPPGVPQQYRHAAMTRRRLTAPGSLLLHAGAAVALGVAAAGVLPGFLEALGYLLPAVLLLLALLGRCYPGEHTLLGLVRDGRPRRREARSPTSTARPRPRTLLPRGGRLLAFSLAVRPPPASLLARS